MTEATEVVDRYGVTHIYITFGQSKTSNLIRWACMLHEGEQVDSHIARRAIAHGRRIRI